MIKLLSWNKAICIKTNIPQEICEIDDEMKAIYHSKDTVCIWVRPNATGTYEMFS